MHIGILLIQYCITTSGHGHLKEFRPAGRTCGQSNAAQFYLWLFDALDPMAGHDHGYGCLCTVMPDDLCPSLIMTSVNGIDKLEGSR